MLLLLLQTVYSDNTPRMRYLFCHEMNFVLGKILLFNDTFFGGGGVGGAGGNDILIFACPFRLRKQADRDDILNEFFFFAVLTIGIYAPRTPRVNATRLFRCGARGGLGRGGGEGGVVTCTIIVASLLKAARMVQ